MQKKFQYAIKECLNILKIHNQSTEINNLIAYCFIQTKNYEDAIKFYNKIIKNEPDNYLVYFNIGIVQTAQKNYDLSIQSYKKAILLNSDYTDAYFNLALLDVKMENYSNAIQNFKTN